MTVMKMKNRCKFKLRDDLREMIAETWCRRSTRKEIDSTVGALAK